MYSSEELRLQLEQLQAPAGSIVLMHASMRAIGPVQGGAEGLLALLMEYFTREGGLFCVPTHTWYNLGTPITMDMTADDANVGILPSVALRSGRGIRSESPVHSMVVFGDRDRAMDFVRDEPFIRSSTAPESCYGKLYTQGGFVLLAGVAQNRNTYLHCVEEILGIPDRLADTPTHTAVRRPSGEIVERDIFLHHTSITRDISSRYVKFDTPFRYHRCIRDGFLGNAPAQLCDARKMKETVERILCGSGGIDPLLDEKPIPQKWYCVPEKMS